MGTEGLKLTSHLQLTPSSKMVELYLYSPYASVGWCLITQTQVKIYFFIFRDCHSMHSGRSLLTFRSSVLPSVSGLKIKPGNQTSSYKRHNTILHGVICQKMALSIVTAMKTSNPTQCLAASWNPNQKYNE
jgi:hypothetical protein